nr:hypothetical protein Q903MT_gene641 [Picea sitchensis]
MIRFLSRNPPRSIIGKALSFPPSGFAMSSFLHLGYKQWARRQALLTLIVRQVNEASNLTLKEGKSLNKSM